jgi:hypothetical protein
MVEEGFGLAAQFSVSAACLAHAPAVFDIEEAREIS